MFRASSRAQSKTPARGLGDRLPTSSGFRSGTVEPCRTGGVDGFHGIGAARTVAPDRSQCRPRPSDNSDNIAWLLRLGHSRSRWSWTISLSRRGCRCPCAKRTACNICRGNSFRFVHSVRFAGPPIAHRRSTGGGRLVGIVRCDSGLESFIGGTHRGPWSGACHRRCASARPAVVDSSPTSV